MSAPKRFSCADDIRHPDVLATTVRRTCFANGEQEEAGTCWRCAPGAVDFFIPLGEDFPHAFGGEPRKVCMSEPRDIMMSELPDRSRAISDALDGGSLFSWGNTILRHRHLVAVFVLLGMLVGVAASFALPQKYLAEATFIPEGSRGGSSDLALAASQFGLTLSSADGGVWGPATYVALVYSRAFLEPIAGDTFLVAEDGHRRAALVDLLRVPENPPARRMNRTVRELRRVVVATELKKLNAVKLTVSTPWPSVSQALATRIVNDVSRFSIETRRSQAKAEREFVDGRVQEAEEKLRQAEEHLQSFLQHNRVTATFSELGFDRERLQRAVDLQSGVYSALLRMREEAKIREVRDTPVITLLEGPRVPAAPEPRGAALKGILGVFTGGMLGLLWVFIAHGIHLARQRSDPEAQEFFRRIGELRLLPHRRHR